MEKHNYWICRDLSCLWCVVINIGTLMLWSVERTDQSAAMAIYPDMFFFSYWRKSKMCWRKELDKRHLKQAMHWTENVLLSHFICSRDLGGITHTRSFYYYSHYYNVSVSFLVLKPQSSKSNPAKRASMFPLFGCESGSSKGLWVQSSCLFWVFSPSLAVASIFKPLTPPLPPFLLLYGWIPNRQFGWKERLTCVK